MVIVFFIYIKDLGSYLKEKSGVDIGLIDKYMELLYKFLKEYYVKFIIFKK